MGDDREVNATDAQFEMTSKTAADEWVSAQAPAEPDQILANAVDVARGALSADVGNNAQIGEHLGVVAEATRSGAVVTHNFAANLDGYVGWHWAISISRADDSDHVTICEVVLLPGAGAITVAPWLPWSERLRPEDVHPGDVVPSNADDDRLVPAYIHNDDPAIEEVAFELGLGRERVMSREGRLDTATRWHTGQHGPTSAMAKHAPAHCGTCGFYLPLAGSLRSMFGACGNEVSPADGAVVTADFGCGAHSEATISHEPETRVEYSSIYDTTKVDLHSLARPKTTREFTEEQRGRMAQVLAAARADGEQRARTRDASGSAQDRLSPAVVAKAVAAAFAARGPKLEPTNSDTPADAGGQPEGVSAARRNRTNTSALKKTTNLSRRKK